VTSSSEMSLFPAASRLETFRLTTDDVDNDDSSATSGRSAVCLHLLEGAVVGRPASSVELKEVELKDSSTGTFDVSKARENDRDFRDPQWNDVWDGYLERPSYEEAKLLSVSLFDLSCCANCFRSTKKSLSLSLGTLS